MDIMDPTAGPTPPVTAEVPATGRFWEATAVTLLTDNQVLLDMIETGPGPIDPAWSYSPPPNTFFSLAGVPMLPVSNAPLIVV
jgi:hypothetical protein